MDKVTQSNAASAEESASAAEEMTAQAEALKDAVAELLRLVDGHKTYAATSVKASSARPAQRVLATTPNRTLKSGSGGNGAAAPARVTTPVPALAAAGGRKSGGIPLEGEFKDF
jgi:thioredoxin-like negative regulator of GroEL